MYDVWIWMIKQFNFGVLNGIKVVNVSGVRYWIVMYDEVKKGVGFIVLMLLWMIYIFKDVVVMVDSQLRDEGKVLDYDFVELGFGDGLVLE